MSATRAPAPNFIADRNGPAAALFIAARSAPRFVKGKASGDWERRVPRSRLMRGLRGVSTTPDDVRHRRLDDLESAVTKRLKAREIRA